MKGFFIKSMAFLMVMAMSVSLAACGDDDNDNNINSEPEVPQQKYSEIVMKYTLSLSQEYYDLWDIQVTYTGRDGETKTETIDRNWTVEYRYNPQEEIPESFTFNVQGLPKTGGVNVVPDKIYKLAKSHQFVATGISSTGNVLIGGEASLISTSMSYKGEQLSTRLAEGIKITEGQYKIKL